MRKISHMPARQIYSAKVSSPEQRIIYLGSQILNWSLRPALPVGNTDVSMEQRCDLLIMLKVRTMTLSKQREPLMNQKEPKKQNPCFASVCCTQKKISILLSATTVLQACLLAAQPAQALLSSRFFPIYTFTAVCEAV